ncbi:3-oxoacyl-ACP synthase III family protein [Actinomadura macrotermitis]|uniref:Acetoacetyl CoA synthase NphT7 n=1 Tax=Actinomadura macrotermitis TaxID=2585200 RepID=A0A7K0C425_9ACTN|nr:ketoacyl-ACP synthase III [Actinomadura macrotermitis]MQY07852.1 Acetoacetyl CoA synthase NphT7 [Actinomadura macrotermitis]
MGIGILGTGAYVPEEIVDNATVAQWTDVPESWIDERTGVFERRYAPEGARTSDLAVRAVRDLETQCPQALGRLAAMIVATSTPDQPQPATAAILQGRLGLGGFPALDINAVCSGALYGLVTGAAFSSFQEGTPVLLVAADMYSKIVDGRDRRTASLFGDGAGAVLLGRVPDGFGLGPYRLTAHGEFAHYVEVTAGGTRQPIDGAALAGRLDRFRMHGPEVREYVIRILPELISEVLDEAGLRARDIDRWILHQANPRLLEELSRLLAVDPTLVPVTGSLYGNSAAASLLVTLNESVRAKPLERGARVMFASVGGGMTAGAALLTWY